MSESDTVSREDAEAIHKEQVRKAFAQAAEDARIFRNSINEAIRLDLTAEHARAVSLRDEDYKLELQAGNPEGTAGAIGTGSAMARVQAYERSEKARRDKDHRYFVEEQLRKMMDQLWLDLGHLEDLRDRYNELGDEIEDIKNDESLSEEEKREQINERDEERAQIVEEADEYIEVNRESLETLEDSGYFSREDLEGPINLLNQIETDFSGYQGNKSFGLEEEASSPTVVEYNNNALGFSDIPDPENNETPREPKSEVNLGFD